MATAGQPFAVWYLLATHPSRERYHSPNVVARDRTPGRGHAVGRQMTAPEARAFVKANGIVLESARGPAPSLAATIAGEPIRGSWWKHRKAAQIFRCSRAVRDSKKVLVCRLLGGRVTYVHRRLWPALVKLHDRFDPKHLNAIREVHTPQGKHQIITVPFPKWVPRKVTLEAASLAAGKAAEMLGLKLRAERQH